MLHNCTTVCPDPMPFCLHKRVNDTMESTEISKEWLTLVVEHIEKHKRTLGNSTEHENRHSSCVSLLTLSMPLSYKANQSLWTERLTEVNNSRHQNNCWKICHLNVNNTMLKYRVLFRFQNFQCDFPIKLQFVLPWPSFTWVILLVQWWSRQDNNADVEAGRIRPKCNS